MIKVKTTTGFEVKIDENVINKYSFVKTMGNVSKHPEMISDLIGLVLGADEDRLIEHLGGNPTVEEMAKEIAEIFDAIRENKETKN